MLMLIARYYYVPDRVLAAARRSGEQFCAVTAAPLPGTEVTHAVAIETILAFLVGLELPCCMLQQYSPSDQEP